MLASAPSRDPVVRFPVAADPDWQDLRDRFVEASTSAAAEDCLGGWLTVWRIVIEHPWYRAELTAAARTAVRRVGGPLCWREDVEQDAVLLLAKKLRRDPRLGLDPLRAEHQFAAWLGRILRNDCRQAVRRLRRLSRGGELPQELPARSRGSEEEEARLDLDFSIERLPEPLRTVLLLNSKGLALREIAERLGLSYWQSWRIWRDGCDRLRETLS